MIDVQVRKPIVDVESEYSGKGVKFSPSQTVSMMARAFDDTITTKLVKKVGPMYSGELERLILDPLVGLSTALLKANYTYRDVTKFFAARSLSFSIIDQVIKVYEVREVARYLTSDMLETSDIYRTMQRLGDDVKTHAGERQKHANDVKKKGGVQTDQPDKSKELAPNVLKLVQEFIQGKSFRDNVDMTTIQDLLANDEEGMNKIMLASCFSIEEPSAFDEVDKTISEVYEDFVNYAKTGKGMALTGEGRARVMQKLSIVRAAVSDLFDYALGETDPSVQLARGLAAMALGVALLSYLKMAEEPDAFFPKQELQFNVIAWAGGLKTEASELKEFWMYHALAPASFTVSLAHRLWTEEASWAEFMGPEFELMTQARDALTKASERFDVVVSPFFKALAEKAVDDLLVRNGATKLLPIHMIYSDKFDSAYTATIERLTNEEIEWEYQEGNDTTQPTKMFTIPCRDKRKASEMMAEQAQNIVNAYDVTVRAAQLISLVPDDPQPVRSLVDIGIEDLMWRAVRPVQANEILTFSMPEATSAALPAWDGADWPTKWKSSTVFQPKWSHRDYLYKLFRPNRLLASRLSKQPVVFMWDKDTVPEVMGDAITRPWGMQPIPACYTYTRNRSIRPYTMLEYLNSMQGAVDGIPSSDYLRHAAELIVTYGPDDKMAQSLIDYLSPIMSVAMYHPAHGTLERIRPRLKTLYGVPVAEFYAIQPNPIDPYTDEGEMADSRPRTAAYKLMSDTDGKEVTVVFTLHEYFPKPHDVVPMAQTLESGLTIFAPLSKKCVVDYFSGADLAAKDFGSDMLGDICKTWKPEAIISNGTWYVYAGGFAPFKTWMPGTYFRAFARNDNLVQEADIMYATAAAVKWKISSVTGSLQIRGFIQDPICLLDNSDRMKALDMVDPVPENLQIVKPENVSQGTQEPGHEEGPDPATLKSQTREEKNITGAATAKTYLPGDTVDGDRPKVDTIEPQDSNAREAEKPLTGSPSSDDEVWVVVEDEQGKKLKKVKKGEVPEGARLASDDEIAQWLKENGHEGK